ncbi:hypothetical protein [Tsuneonella litorea]|uniref:hypothetical protein n=1 Tax=Tsuneonella litorea TaxID=2976475 RepID=UPI0021A3F655|nr:hypothetical protein [Tsuneonella litorea]
MFGQWRKEPATLRRASFDVRTTTDLELPMVWFRRRSTPLDQDIHPSSNKRRSSVSAF